MFKPSPATKMNAAGALFASFFALTGTHSDVMSRGRLRGSNGKRSGHGNHINMKPFGVRTKGYNQIHGNGRRIDDYQMPF